MNRVIAIGALSIMAAPVWAEEAPISKPDGNAPKIYVVSPFSVQRIQQCLSKLDGYPTPQVFRQADRPHEVHLLWQTGTATLDRAELSLSQGGTVVKIWNGSDQMESCARTGDRK